MMIVDTATFLDAVIPQGNRYIGYTDGTKNNAGKEMIKCSSFKEAQVGVGIGNRNGRQDRNVFFAVASFKQAKIYDEKKGYEKSFRHQTNVDRLKSLWLDVDYKSYDTPQEAIAAVGKFVNDTAILKPTFVVSTGGGLHLYWSFEEELSAGRWLPLAQGLAGFAKYHGLRADYGVTIDSARVLRLPETFNQKYPAKPKCQVEQMNSFVSIDRMYELLSPYSAEQNPQHKQIILSPNVINMFHPGMNKDLQENYDVGLKSFALPILEGCGVMREALETQGATNGYPIWKDLLHLLAYTEDGEDYIHEISKGYHSYDAHETVARYEESVTLRRDGSRGPTSCQRFSTESNKCAQCKFAGKIKSPWSLGVTIENPEKDDPTYCIGETTYKTKYVDDGDGNMVPEQVEVVPAALTDWRLVPIIGDPKNHYHLRVECRAGAFNTTLDIPLSSLEDDKGLRKVMLKSYLSWQDPDMRKFRSAAMAWAETLSKRESVENVEHMGWGPGCESFVIGDEHFTSTGVERIAAAGDYGRDYGKVGEPAAWNQLAAHLVNDARDDFGFILAAGFAGPLMRLGTPLSIAISAYSINSGTGKSTALRCAQAAFGNPIQTFALDDTANYIQHRAGVLRDMPMIWDEIRGESVARSLANTLFRFTQGKTKGRLDSHAEARATSSLNTMLLCGTNTPIADHVREEVPTADAGAMRFLEFEMQGSPSDPGMVVYKLLGKLSKNYGHAGRKYVQYLLDNMKDVEKTLEQVATKVSNTFEFQVQERFWHDALIKVVTAAVLMHKANIVAIDPKRVLAFGIQVVKSQRVAVTETAVDEKNVVAEIITEHANSVLVTKRFTRGKGDAFTPLRQPPFGKVCTVHVGVEENEVRITNTAITNYCLQRKLSPTNMRAFMVAQLGGEKKKVSIGAGTAFAQPQTRVMCFPLGKVNAEALTWDSSSAPRDADTSSSSSQTPSPGSSTDGQP